MADVKKKTIALDKSLKIDKAQRNMFVAVCLASVVLGVTAVLVIYFSKVISFNSHIIEEKNKTLVGFKTSQDNIASLKESVNGLVNNENLESVARKRSGNCITDKNSATEVISEEEKQKQQENKKNELNLSRTCTSLRVMPDALPATLNGNAMMSNVLYLIKYSNNGYGVATESVELKADEDADDGEASELTDAIHSISTSVKFKDSSTRVKGVLSMFEGSIRNFDITDINISWNQDDSAPEYSFTYKTYYSDKVNIDLKKRIVCANKENEKCSGAGGDTIGDEYGAIDLGDTEDEGEVEE